METNPEMNVRINSLSVSNTKKKKQKKNKVKLILEDNINIIERFIKYCHTIYSNLDNINYNNTIINYYSIHSFYLSTKTNNDKNNKIRETIIGAIINSQIPTNYYKYSLLWKKLKYEIDNYILNLCILNKLTNQTQKCVHKAGRTHNYDLLLIINECITFNIEIKFNAENVNQSPQFVSPMKPSQYLETSYEKYYYDNYLTILSKEFNLPLPNKEEYIHKIHSDKPKCVVEYQNKYYKGCKNSSKYTGMEEDIKFYNKAKKLSEDSIKTFITNNNLKVDELTNYLLNTQTNKVYMLYKNGNIYLQCIDPKNYEIVSYKKEPELQRYVATTKTGIILKILLRWKNGNGIAYPAFQIS
jgi:hypothetical protein